MNQIKYLIPKKLQELLVSYDQVLVTKGRLGDEIIKYEDKKHKNIYLKSGDGISAKSLNLEASALAWLAGKGLNVPEIMFFDQKKGKTFLLISGVPGLPAHKIAERNKSEILKIVANALRKFHRTNLFGAETLNNLEDDLDKIYKHLKMGVINRNKFVAANDGKPPEDVFEYLRNNKVNFDKNSLIHGDFCLPNILIDQGNFGFIDLGDCGPGDKYKDFSSMEVSIKRNFGTEWIEIFYKYYDPKLIIDRKKIHYYQLIDQFGYHLDIDKYRLSTMSSEP